MLALCLCLFGCKPKEAGFTIYTNPATTTPQLAFLCASKCGLLKMNVTQQDWRNNMQFQALLLAGKGDLWIGSIDTMLKAQAKGAPLRIMAVTGWRKWVLISQFERLEDITGQVATAPMGNPAASLLSRLAPKLGPIIQTETRLLTMKLLAGQVKTALLAEPIASSVIQASAKSTNPLHRVIAIEDLKAQVEGGTPRIPWAGIAVNVNSERRCPELAENILLALEEATSRLNSMSQDEIAAYWPDKFCQNISRQQLKASLTNDVIHIERLNDALLQDFAQLYGR